MCQRHWKKKLKYKYICSCCVASSFLQKSSCNSQNHSAKRQILLIYTAKGSTALKTTGAVASAGPRSRGVQPQCRLLAEGVPGQPQSTVKVALSKGPTPQRLAYTSMNTSQNSEAAITHTSIKIDEEIRDFCVKILQKLKKS